MPLGILGQNALGQFMKTPHPSRKDLVAVITGGMRGIGLATVHALKTRGVKVAVGARSAADPAERNKFVRDHGNDIFVDELDVRSLASVHGFIEKVEDRIGPVDILINSAGVSLHQTICQHTEEDWDSVIDINLSGTFRMIKACLPGMIERKWGRIVNVASTAARVSMVDSAAYSASKAGIVGLTKAVAIEGAPYNVTCTAVSPTWIETDMLHASAAEAALEQGCSTDDVLAEIAQSNPQNRLVQADEVAELIAFLCGENARAVTMEDIQINAAALW